jgi:hypothetical protein
MKMSTIEIATEETTFEQEAGRDRDLRPRAAAIARALVDTADANGVSTVTNGGLAVLAGIPTTALRQATDVSRTLRVLRKRGLIAVHYNPLERSREIHILDENLVITVLGLLGRLAD